MSISQHLRVIGSRGIYQFFLPPQGSAFPSSEFLLVESNRAATVFPGVPNNGALTLLVNPDDYSAADIDLLPAPTCLWFLRRLALDGQESYRDAPQLLSIARQEIQKRVSFLETLYPSGPASVVVSDRASVELCRTMGIQAVLSPPPVNDGVARARLPATAMSLAWRAEPGPYAAQFQRYLDSEFTRDGDNHVIRGASLDDITHSIVIQRSVVREFPYEVALCLAAGHTVMSQALEPLWGLEPGIDFVEVSTPEELHYAVEALRRSPSSTALMSRRGQAKAQHFESSRVLSRVLSFADDEMKPQEA